MVVSRYLWVWFLFLLITGVNLEYDLGRISENLIYHFTNKTCGVISSLYIWVDFFYCEYQKYFLNWNKLTVKLECYWDSSRANFLSKVGQNADILRTFSSQAGQNSGSQTGNHTPLLEHAHTSMRSTTLTSPSSLCHIIFSCISEWNNDYSDTFDFRRARWGCLQVSFWSCLIANPQC